MLYDEVAAAVMSIELIEDGLTDNVWRGRDHSGRVRQFPFDGYGRFHVAFNVLGPSS